MNFKNLLKTKLRSFFGVQQIQEQIIEIRHALLNLDPNLSLSKQDINRDNKFTIQIEYPPSRDLRP